MTIILNKAAKVLQGVTSLGNRKGLTPLLFVLPTSSIMVILVFYPIAAGIIYSFTDMTQYNMGNQFLSPSWQLVGLSNYLNLFNPATPAGHRFWSVTGQTAVWVVGSVFFQFSIGLGLALLANKPLSGRAIYRAALLLPWAVPTYVTAFAWKWLYNSEYGLLNMVLTNLGLEPINWLSHPQWAMFSVILANIWLGIPFNFIVILGALQSVGHEYLEAAVMDGANRWQRFRYVIIPLIRPVLQTALLLGIIWTFNQFNVIYLITQGGPNYSTEILVTYAYFEAFTHWRIGLATAYTTVTFLILLAFSVWYVRSLRATERLT